jgi:UDP-glucose 4-epimerase
MDSQMRTLITGGAGFIGSHLSESLLDRGDEVFCLDDLSTGSLENILNFKDNPRFHFVLGSILEETKVEHLVKEADQIYHLAAAVGVKLIFENPIRTIRVNVKGTETVLDAALKYAKKTLIVSTSEVYGKDINPGTPKFREDQDLSLGLSLRWAYACTKALDEYLARSYQKKMGLPTVIVRLFNTVGPRQSAEYGMVIPRLVIQALSGQPITVYGDGAQVRSFTWVKDAVSALTGLMDAPHANGEIFNVGGEEAVTIGQVAQRIKAKTGSASPIVHIPYEQAYGKDFEDVRFRVPDTTKLRGAIGFRPTMSLDQILDAVIAYQKGPGTR